MAAPSLGPAAALLVTAGLAQIACPRNPAMLNVDDPHRAEDQSILIAANIARKINAAAKNIESAAPASSAHM